MGFGACPRSIALHTGGGGGGAGLRDDRRFSWSERGGDSGPSSLPSFSDFLPGLGCLASTAITLAGLHALIKRNPANRKLSTADVFRRGSGYLIGAGLVACKVGADLGGSLHGKLSERGRRDRENMLLEAVRTGKPKTYSDGPLTGTVTPQRPYTDPETRRKCTTTVDVLLEGKEASQGNRMNANVVNRRNSR